MEDQLLNEILKTTYTLESFKKRVMVLKLRIEKQVFKSDQAGVDDGHPIPEISRGSLREAKEWAESFSEEILNSVNSENFNQVFDSVEQFISGSTPLTVYFVFTPDDEQVKEIGERLRKSLGNPKLIFSVKVNPNLIGGCAIAYKGVIKDYSLKAKISESKEKLVEEFRKYLKQ